MMTTPRSRVPWLATLTCATLSLALFPGAKNGCGSKEATQTLLSPVQAVATLLERADGQVDAELVLISTASLPDEFVETAREVQMRMPQGDAVPLLSSSPGHYGASSSSSPSLVYVPGGTYQFRFDLDDEAAAKNVAGGSFVAVMDAPDDEVTFSLDRSPKFAGDTAHVTWSPSNRYAIINIRNERTGELTYSTFDFTEPKFDGSKWSRLPKGGAKDLSVDSFPEAGTYTVSLCAVAKVSDFDTSLSAELGALSGFLIGRCGQDIEVTVSP